MDEKLISAIQKIKLLAEQNPEFHHAMQKLFGNTASASLHAFYDDRISHIEKYLGLDYSVDSQPSLIDYDFIREWDVRAQLISDNREMMRFRYGTRYHSINFEEFCRYAHLQAEMLLNYFYDKMNPSIEDALQHIKRHNLGAKLDGVKSLEAIPYNVKLWAFRDEGALDYAIVFVLDNLRKVRNESSHRSPGSEQNLIQTFKMQLVNMSIPLRQDGDVDFYKLKAGTQEYNLYSNMVKNQEWYKEYRYLIWLHGEPYDQVVGALETLKTRVKTLTGGQSECPSI